MAKECRFAVGRPDSRRSTVWKFAVQKSDVYIVTRMFGSEAKVSLHNSGVCQWSATDNWVKKVPGRRNAERHIVRWSIPRPNGSNALHVFRIQIPESELREYATTENLTKVKWLDIPMPESAVSLECYLTPPTNSDPIFTSNFPCPHLASLPLADSRWLVVLHNVVTLNKHDLENLRIAILHQTSSLGYTPKPEHRIAAFFESPDIARGLVELCAITE